VLFLKPLKVANTLHMHWLSVDRRGHKVECALGDVGQDSGSGIKTIRAAHPAALNRVNELAAFFIPTPAALIIDAITGTVSHQCPRK
jgi:hypothetical protein